jgi:hypothetical protein
LARTRNSRKAKTSSLYVENVKKNHGTYHTVSVCDMSAVRKNVVVSSTYHFSEFADLVDVHGETSAFFLSRTGRPRSGQWALE